MVNSRKDFVQLAILLVINLLNYVDRNTVAGVLQKIQDYYDIDDTWGGLIETVFLVAFIIVSPLTGYIGDRYTRKWIIVVGMVIWLISVVASTFAPANMFWLFMVFRGIVGVGEATYSNVSPSMITDMFTGQTLARMYMLYYMAVPIGSGLGFVVGSSMASLFGSWQWGVRITAVAGVVGLLCLIFFVEEPKKRNLKDAVAGTEKGVEVSEQQPERTSYSTDLYKIFTNKTFVGITIGYTALVFCAGTMAWWIPTAAEHGIAARDGYNDTKYLPDDVRNKQNSIFGGITILGGLIGVTAGTFIAGFWKTGFTIGSWKVQSNRALPYVCAIGSAVACILLTINLTFCTKHPPLVWAIISVTMCFLCLNWGLNVDVVMSVVSANRRSTAFSIYMLTGHLLGDAPGPYIIGAISDATRKNDTPAAHYRSLVNAFYLNAAMLAVSAYFYLFSAFAIEKDIQRCIDESATMPKKVDPIAGDSDFSSNRTQSASCSSCEQTKL